MTNLYIDIETIPAQRPEVLAEIKATKEAELAESIAAVKPPGTYKKQETIDEWVKTEQPKVIQALRDACEADIDATYRKTSFDGAFGNVCVIGWVFDDDEPRTVSNILDEKDLLLEFRAEIGATKFNLFESCVIGHNVAAFDLRFLMQRHIVHGVKPHPVIVRGAQAKPWESDKVFDTMIQWAGVGNRVSLDKLCKALKIPTPKGEIDGSKVWDFVQQGRLDEVAAYCRRDVEATRLAHKAMTFQ